MALHGFTVIFLTIGTIKAEPTLHNKIRLLLRTALYVIPFVPIRRIAALKIENPNFLTLKAPITTAADDIHKYFFIVFQRK